MAASYPHTSDRESSQPTAASPAGNKFANDGSFMEMFKRQMEERMKAREGGDTSTVSRDDSAAATRSGQDDEKGKRALDVERSGVRGESERLVETPPTNLSSSAKPYQGFAGKRKTLLKSAELREKRKKRREELEDQRAAESEEGRSNAWKAYMAEVKAYEARSCSDSDGHKRPLVK